jgi:bifunctional non-homologous end joining protein LigD
MSQVTAPTRDELDDPDLRPDRWTVRSTMERVATVGDPFARLLGLPQELPSLTSSQKEHPR